MTFHQRIQSISSLLQRSFIKHKVYKLSDTILVAGCGRSGTTWLIELMNTHSEYRVVFEPFNKEYNKTVKKIMPKRLNLAKGDSYKYTQELKQILQGNITSKWTDTVASTNYFAKKQIVKEIRLNRMLPWIQSTFPEMKIIYIVRDPYSVAYSATEREWFANLIQWYLPPRDYMKRHLTEQQITLLKKASTIAQNNFAIWALENYLVIKYVDNKNVLSLYYEHIVSEPDDEMKRVADFCNTDFHSVSKKSNVRSVLATKESVVDENVDNFGKRWVGHFSRQDMQYAEDLLRIFGLNELYQEHNIPSFNAPFELRSRLNEKV